MTDVAKRMSTEVAQKIRKLRRLGWTLTGIAEQVAIAPELVAITCGEDPALLGNRKPIGGRQ